MKRMSFVFAITIPMVLCAASGYASYTNSLTNLSANWISNPAGRLAATDSADGVAMNPAGLVRMEDGIHVHFSSQSIDNHYKIRVEDAYPGQKVTEQNKPSKFVPSLYANRKRGDWSFFGGVNIYGGGGSLYFEDGTPNLNMAVWGIEALAARSSMLTGSPVDPWSNGKKYFNLSPDPNQALGAGVSSEMLSMMPAFSFGAAYAVSSRFSVAGGARIIYGQQTIKIAARSAGLYGGKDTLYDAEWTTLGGLLFASVNYRPVERLNLAAMVESWAPMKWKVDVKEDLSHRSPAFNNEHALSSMSGYIDGRTFRFDEPAKLFLGADYALTQALNVNAMFMLYMPMWGEYKKPTSSTPNNPQTGTTYTLNETDYDLDPGFEAGVGADWKISANTTLSTGLVYNRINYRDNYHSELVMKNDLFNVGAGIKTQVNHRFIIGVGYMRNIYFDAKNSDQIKDPTGRSYEATYSKKANVLAFSLEYRFM